MVKTNTLQATFSAGELDPLLAAREDVKHYYRGAQRMRNVVALPQGGFRRRQGLKFKAEVLQKLTQISWVGATLSAPNGGAPSSATDGVLNFGYTSVNNINAASPFVLFQADFGAPILVDVIDVIGLSVATASVVISTNWSIQYSNNGSTWSMFDSDWDITQNKISVRRGAAAPVSARYWRVAGNGSGVAAPAEIYEVILYRANGGLSNAVVVPYTFSDAQEYTMVATEGNLRVYKAGARVGDIKIPHSSASLPALTWAQSLDTLLLFHSDYAPYRVFRLGFDSKWEFKDQPFTNMPRWNYGNSPGGVNHRMELVIAGTWTSNSDALQLELEGQTTSDIEYNSTAATFAARVQAALRALKNTSDTGIVVTNSSGTRWYIDFTGDDGARFWERINVNLITRSGGIAYCVTITEGATPGEDIFSSSRKYPRCGCFYGQRLWMGGLYSLPTVVLYSVTGDFFNLDNKLTLADRGAVVRADTDKVSIMRHLFPGAHLLALSSNTEFWNPTDPIETPKVSLKNATQNGVREGVRPFEIDGAVFFAQENSNAIRQFVFSDTVNNYTATNIALLAAHLIVNPTASAFRKGRTTDEADLLMYVNSDGTMPAFTVLSSEEVNAWSLFSTAGKFVGGGVEGTGTVYCVTERTINGVTRRYLEAFDGAMSLDCGDIVTAGMPRSTVPSLTHLANTLVHVRVDGVYRGTATIDGAGLLTIPGAAATTSIEYGLYFDIEVKNMPIRLPLPSGTIMGTKKRIYEVVASLYRSYAFSLAANDGPADPVGVSDNFTGELTVEGLQGWTDDGQITISQPIPGPLTVRGLAMRVSHHG